MNESTTQIVKDDLEHLVTLAKSGDHTALERVIQVVQPDIYSLAVRFLWLPQDAEDATQEILVRILTHLSSYRGDSRFKTWVYRVACNSLLSFKKRRTQQQAISFEQFADDLALGLSENEPSTEDKVSELLLMEEVKIGCTLAMLQCLDHNHRLAYILGDIMELDHKQASEALAITPSAYRKRISRARSRVTSFMTGHCGLFNPSNPCRCRRRIDRAVSLNRVDPADLRFAKSPRRAKAFPRILAEIRLLEEERRAAALYRSLPESDASDKFNDWLKKLLREISHRHDDERITTSGGV